MLELAGYRLRTGWPGSCDRVAVWGQRPVSRRGQWVARRSGAGVLCIEDGFLHSIHPSLGDGPVSLVLDDLGIYFDASRPSRLEHLLSSIDLTAPEDAQALLDKLLAARISKYTPVQSEPLAVDDYVLVVDQTAGDASIHGAGACPETFHRMLSAARRENPGKAIVVKAHPEAAAGRKLGHFIASDLWEGELWLDRPCNPWDALAGARVVYTVSSQLGYEAVLAQTPVRCFGRAFYAGWGLTEDELDCPRRTRRLSVPELFLGCHVEYPIYYDPWRDRLTDLGTAIEVLAAERDCRARAAADEQSGDVFVGVRLWKRRNVAQFLPGRRRPPRFTENPGRATEIARAEDRSVWLWGSKFAHSTLEAPRGAGIPAGFVEDGFLRSVGLGAELTEAASLVFDRSGIYFDPSRPSDLEEFIALAAEGHADVARAARLREAIVRGRVTKYNLPALGLRAPPPDRDVILVPGQVEDDASILRGCDEVRTNLQLLERVRTANPNAWIIFKPHPDVEAGLRKGAVPAARAFDIADEVALRTSAVELLDMAHEVWTMTSLMGFEALIRGRAVTCLGTPFYAGWGLTTDLGKPCPHRVARPTLDQLVWAALIAYPSYVDPVSGLPCTPELVVERLAQGVPGQRATLLSKAQGLLAGQSWLWRR